MRVDHIHFYVTSAREWKDRFVRTMGFYPIASAVDNDTRTEIVSNGGDRSIGESVIFVLSSPVNDNSPVARYLENYPRGVVDVAFAVSDLETFLTRHSLSGTVREVNYPNGKIKTCSITSSANITHTLIERRGNTPILPLRSLREFPIESGRSSDIIGIDHVVLNVFPGDLEKTVDWYEKYLGFQRQQSFTIQTVRSGLYSRVMVHPDSGVQFPINEPTSPNSQIQEFLDINRREGIQHIALKTRNIVRLTSKLRTSGVDFLTVPGNYYRTLEEKRSHLQFSPEEWRQIQEREILIDFENKISVGNNAEKPTLLQIFTRPIFEEPTFFFELIERRDAAKGFGEGNFQALFEAIEREQMARGSIADDFSIR